MLAQLQSVTPDFLHQATLLGIGLLGGLAAAVGVWAALRKPAGREPQPFRVEGVPQVMTIAECERRDAATARRLDGHDADIRAIYAELKQDRENNARAQSERTRTLYDKIDAVRREVNDRLDTLNQSILRMFGDHERAIGRVESDTHHKKP